ncbi:hypothetical protein ACVWZD_006061 [Streptomyces sp. TE3672]
MGPAGRLYSETSVRRYFHPSAEAIAEVTSLLAPSDSRR